MAWAALAQPLDRLSPGDRSRALTNAQLVELGPGETLLIEDLAGEALWYLFDGELSLRLRTSRSERLIAGTSAADQPLNGMLEGCLGIRVVHRAQLIRLDPASLQRAAPELAEAGRTRGTEGEPDAADEPRDWMNTLLESELFHRLPLRFLPQVFARMEPVYVQSGDVVVSQDETGDYYYIVREGRCQVQRQPHKGSAPVRLAELGVGACFGEEALIGGYPRNASVVMLTNGVVMRLAKTDFQELIQTPLVRQLSQTEANRLVSEGARWVDVRFPDEQEASARPGALNLPLNLLRMRASRLDRNVTYITCCDSGRRAAIGAFLLAERGFDVYSLTGAWKAEPLQARPAAGAPPPPPPAAPVEAPAPAAAILTPQALWSRLGKELTELRDGLERADPLREVVDVALEQHHGEVLIPEADRARIEAATAAVHRARAALGQALNGVQKALYSVPMHYAPQSAEQKDEAPPLQRPQQQR